MLLIMAEEDDEEEAILRGSWKNRGDLCAVEGYSVISIAFCRNDSSMPVTYASSGRPV